MTDIHIDITNCNLSPQGDDNPLRCQNSLFIYNCNLSPQEGKKLRIKKDAEFFFCKP